MELVMRSSTIIGGISTVLNGIFFIFIVLSPPKHLESYKRNYYLGAFTSFFFAASQCLCAYTLFTDGTVLLFLSIRRTGWILFLSIFAHNALFIVIAFNFVQRYGLISNNKFKRWLEDPSRKYLFGFFMVFELLTATIPAHFILKPDISMREYVNAKYGETLLVNFDEDFFYAISYERPLFGHETMNNFAHVGFLFFGGVNIARMIVSGIGMYHFTNGKSRSDKLKMLNQRLLRTLSMQGLFSLIFVYMPSVVCTAAILFRIDFSRASPYVSSAISCGTLFNPIADFILTSDYRNKVRHIFNSASRKSTTVIMSGSVPQKISVIGANTSIELTRSGISMEFVLISSTLVGGTSTLLNGCFFIFIVLYPPKYLGRYKKYYFLGAFASLFFALTHCLCAFSFMSDGSLFLFLSIRRSGKCIFFLFLATHNALFIIIAYNFWQRYGLISNNKWFSDPRLKFLYGSYKTAQLFSTIVPIDIILYPDESIRRLVDGIYRKALLVNFNEDHFHAISHEKPLYGTEVANDLAYIAFLHFGAENITTMFFSGLGIYRFIAGKSRSIKLRKLNQRLLRTLTLQALFSLFFVYMPGLICTGAMFLRLDMSRASPYVSSLMSCGTLFNPIADVILTSEYRKKISQFFKRKAKSSATVAFTSVGPSIVIK